MAVAIESSNEIVWSNQTARSWTITPTGLNRCLVLFGVFRTATSNGVTSSVTVGGTNATYITKKYYTNYVWSELYYFINPSLSELTCTWTLDRSANSSYPSISGCFSLSGVHQDTPISESGVANGASSATFNYSTAEVDGMIFSCAYRESAVTWDAPSIEYHDAGIKTVAYSSVLTVTNPVAKVTGTNVYMSTCAVAPHLGPPKVKTWNGVAIANVKTINGVAIANVKSIQGLT